jgi:PEP-CTERM motif
MRLKCFLTVLIVLAFGLNASAETFSFSMSGVSDSGGGTVTASTTGTPGEFLVTGISGTFDGSAISGVLAPGVYAPVFPILSDNLIYYPSTTGEVDFNGLTFDTASGNDVDLYYAYLGGPPVTGPFYLLGESQGGGELDQLTSFTLTPTSPTPEPSSFLLLGSGLLSLAGMVRRRIRTN